MSETVTNEPNVLTSKPTATNAIVTSLARGTPVEP